MTGSLIIAIGFAIISVLGALIVAGYRDAARTKEQYRVLQAQYRMLSRLHDQEVQNLKALKREIDKLKPKQPRVVT